jgi:hypothetical protein
MTKMLTLLVLLIGTVNGYTKEKERTQVCFELPDGAEQCFETGSTGGKPIVKPEKSQCEGVQGVWICGV